MKPKKTTPAINARVISLVVLCVMVIAYGVFAVLGIHGARFGENGLYRWMTLREATNLGMDLDNGKYTVYQMTDPGDGTLDALAEETLAVMQNRLRVLGRTDATIARLGTDSIRVDLAESSNAEAVFNFISARAYVEFQDANGATMLESKDIQSALVTSSTAASGGYAVQFTLTEDGKQRFADLTAANINQSMSVYLDGELIAEPTVTETVSTGTGLIDGGYSYDTAVNIAMLIHAGEVPVDLIQTELSILSAALGADALNSMLWVGGVAILLVMLYMLVRFKLGGVVIDMTLAVLILAVLYMLAVMDIHVTLASTLGVLLGIALCVGTCVLFFDRVKGELAGGRSVQYAAKVGYQSVMPTVVDTCMAVIITALAFMMVGEGAVKSFAQTLSLCAVSAMIASSILSRLLLWMAVTLGFTNAKLFVR